MEFAKEGSWILQMLNDFQRENEIVLFRQAPRLVQVHLMEWKRMAPEREPIAAGDPGESFAMQEIQKVPTAAPGVEDFYVRVRKPR